MKKQSGKRVIKAWAVVSIEDNDIWAVRLFEQNAKEHSLEMGMKAVPCTITLKEKGRKL